MAHRRVYPIQIRAAPVDVAKGSGSCARTSKIRMGPAKESKVHNLIVHIHFELVWTPIAVVPIPRSVLIKGKADQRLFPL